MLRYPTEPLPKHPAYDEESHGLRSAIDGSLAKLLEVTSDDTCDDTEMKRIHERIDEVYEPRKPPTLKIALVGDAGVGKSSLINSVLHIPGIAKTSAVADSCTAVPTEFKGADQDQNDTYKAVVRYRSRKEIDKFIQMQVCAYRNYHVEDSEGEDEQEIPSMLLQADTCKTIFLALFKDRRLIAGILYFEYTLRCLLR